MIRKKIKHLCVLVLSVILSLNLSFAQKNKNKPIEIGVEYCNTLINTAESIQQKEDDAEEKIIQLFVKELDKISDNTCKYIINSLLAQSLWEYYSANRHIVDDNNSFFSNIEQKTNVKKTILDPSVEVLSHAKIKELTNAFSTLSKDDFVHLIVNSIQNSIPKEIDNSKFTICEQLIKISGDTATYKPYFFDLLAYRAWDILQEMQEANILSYQADTDYIYNILSDFYSKILIESDSVNVYNAIVNLELEKFKRSFESDLISFTQYYSYLENIANEYALYESVGDVYATMAELLMYVDPFKSFELAKKCIADYPNSWGSTNASKITSTLKEPSLAVQVTPVNIEGDNILLSASFKNIDKLNLKLIKLGSALRERYNEYPYPDDKTIVELANKDANSIEVYNSEINLSTNKALKQKIDSLQNCIIELVTPELNSGSYILITSTDIDKLNCYNLFQVSNLSYTFTQIDTNSIGGYVLDRATGFPIKDCEINLFNRHYDYKSKSYLDKKLNEKAVFSNKDGFYSFKFEDLDKDVNGKNLSVFAVFAYENDTISSFNRTHIYIRQNLKDRVSKHRIEWFKDKPIYKKGEQASFKGIATLGLGDSIFFCKNERLRVRLRDEKYKTVFDTTILCDTLGSFTFDFKFGANNLAGDYELSVHGYNNFASILKLKLEEYKRPNFNINLEPKLNNKINISGEVKMFSGLALNNVDVEYEIFLRKAEFSRNKFVALNRHIITRSTVIKSLKRAKIKTDAEGKFSIEIDKSLANDFNSYAYFYEINVAVSDINGEIQTESINIPLKTDVIFIEAKADNVILNDFSEFNLNLKTLDAFGKEMKPKYNIEIYKLVDTLGSPYKRTLQQPTAYFLSDSEFKVKLPLENYYSIVYREKHLLKERVLQTEISNNYFSYSQFNESGLYRYIVSSNHNNRIDTISGDFYFFNRADSNTVTSNIGSDIICLNTTTDKDSEVELFAYNLFRNTINGSLKDKRDKVESVQVSNSVEQAYKAANKKIKADKISFYIRAQDSKGTYVEHHKILSSAYEVYKLNLSKLAKGNIQIICFWQKNNRMFTRNFTISKPFENKNLDIEFVDLPTTMLAGEERTIKFKIKSSTIGKPFSQPIILCINMYDASLDMFAENISLVYPYAADYIIDSGLFRPKYLPSTFYKRYNYARNNWNNIKSTESNFIDHSAYINYRHPNYRLATKEFPISLRWEGFNFYSIMPLMRMKTDAAGSADGAIAVDNAESENSFIEDEEGMVAQVKTPTQYDIRTNFNTTAFFLANCVADSNMEYTFDFKVPESFGKWKIRCFAYNSELYSGYHEALVNVVKPLMLYPQIPRFLRNSDTAVLKCKLILNTEEKQSTDTIFFSVKIKQLAENGAILKEDNYTYNIDLSEATEKTINTGVRLGLNTKLLAYEFYAKLNDSIYDGIGDTIRVYTDKISLKQSYNIIVRSTEEKQIELSDNISTDSLNFSFCTNPTTKIKSMLGDISLDSCVTSLDYLEALKFLCINNLYSKNSNIDIKVKYYLDKIISFVEPTSGGVFWTPNARHTSLFVSQKIVKGLCDLRSSNAFAQLNNKIMVDKLIAHVMKYLDAHYLKNYEKITEKGGLSTEILDYLYVGSTQKKEKTGTEVIKMRECFNNIAKIPNDNYDLYDIATLILYFLNDNDNASSNLWLDYIDKLSLKTEEFGIYWKKERMGNSLGEALKANALMAEVYTKFNRIDDALEMFNYILAQNRTVDIKGGNIAFIGSTQPYISNDDILNIVNSWIDCKFTNIEASKDIVSLKIDKHEFEFAAINIDTILHTKDFEKEPKKLIISVKPVEEGLGLNENIVKYGSVDRFFTSEMQYIEKEDRKKQLSIDKQYSNGQNSFNLGDIINTELQIRADRNFSYLHIRCPKASGVEWLKTSSGYEYSNGLYYYISVSDTHIDFYIDYLPRGYYRLSYNLKADIVGEFIDAPVSIESVFTPGFSDYSSGGVIKIVE